MRPTERKIMFGRKAKDENPQLDDAINRVMEAMVATDKDAEEYSKLIEHLERLTKLKTENRPERISRDTMAIVVANLLGILIVVSYEHMHVITSKGLGFLLKPKGSAHQL